MKRWVAPVLSSAVLAVAACTSTQPVSETVPPSPSLLPPSPTPETLVIGSLPFHSGEVGLAYATVQLGASGGTKPYNWTVAGGTFPPGLVLNSDGSVTGSNTGAGNFSFTVSVSDSQGQSASGPASVTVYAALSTAQPCSGGCLIGAGCQKCGGFGTVKNGATPYTYRIVGGAVPRGMSWGGLAVGGGFPAGNYSLSVQVTDALGAQSTVSANWSIYTAASISSGGSCVDHSTGQCGTTLKYTGGHPSASQKVVILGYSPYCVAACSPTPTAPPPGWSATARGGVISISAGPIVCNTSGYQGYLTLALVDTTNCPTTAQSNQVKVLVDISNGC